MTKRTRKNSYDEEEQFDEMLNEVCEPFRIGTLEYLPSETFKAIDPVAYENAMMEYLDSLDE